MRKIKLVIIGKGSLITNFDLTLGKYITDIDDVISILIDDLSKQIENDKDFITIFGTTDNLSIDRVNINKHKRGFEQIIVYEESPNQLTRKILGTIDYEDLI